MLRDRTGNRDMICSTWLSSSTCRSLGETTRDMAVNAPFIAASLSPFGKKRIVEDRNRGIRKGFDRLDKMI